MKSVLGDRKAITLLLTPALLVYTVIILAPVVWSFGLTFFSGQRPRRLRMERRSRTSSACSAIPYVWDALWFTLKYAILVTIFQVVLGYGLALLYNFVLRKSSVLVRTLVFFPVVLPTVAVALLYQKLFQSAPSDGLVNELLVNVGLSSVDWLGAGEHRFRRDRHHGRLALGRLLRRAGLLGPARHPRRHHRVGTHRRRPRFSLFRHIVLPMSLPILFASFIFSINGTIKVFDSVFALTGGGPGNSTTPLTLYMYRTAFQFSDFGYGSTIALLLTVLCLLVTLVIFRSSRRDNTV